MTINTKAVCHGAKPTLSCVCAEPWNMTTAKCARTTAVPNQRFIFRFSKSVCSATRGGLGFMM